MVLKNVLFLITVDLLFILHVTSNNFNISVLLPCISHLTQIVTREKTSLIFLAEEIKQIDLNDELLQAVPGPNLILHTEKLNATSGFFLLFSNNDSKSYKPLLQVINPSASNKFLVTMHACNSQHKPRETFFEQFWNFRILDIIVLCQLSSDLIHAYQYHPFEFPCNNLKPSLWGVWNVTKKTLFYKEPPFKKTFNFNSCPLICFAKNRPPDSLVRKISETWQLDGVGGKLMMEVRDKFNISIVVQVPKMNVSIDKYGYDVSVGFPELVISLLTNSSIDLAFGIYSHIIYDHNETEFSATAVSECYGWAVPAFIGGEIPAWQYYTQEFNFFSWFLILIIYLFYVAAFYLYFHLLNYHSAFNELHFCGIYILSVFLGISAYPRVSIVRGRLFLGGLLMGSLILSAAYQSILGSFLTVPWKAEQLKYVQQIVDGNYVVLGSPQPGRILNRLAKDVKPLEELSRRYRVHNDHIGSMVKTIQKRKDTVTFAAKRFIQFYIRNELSHSERDGIYLLPECVIQAHSSPFLFKKGSFLRDPVSKLVLRSVEAGLTEYWFKYSTPQIVSSPFSEIFPLSVHRVRTAFSVLVIGLVIAILVFVGEVYSTH